DDAQVFVRGHHDGTDGPNDDLLLVIGGDDDRDLWLIARCGIVLPLAQTVDDGTDAEDDEPGAHQHIADEEDADNNVIEEADEEKGDGVRASLPALPGRQRRHHFGACLSQQLRDRDDLVAMCPQRLDQHGKGSYGRGAIAAAVVQQDDRAFGPGPDIHVRYLLEDAVGDLLWGLARVLVPVVGVDLVAENDVAHALNAIDRRGLIVGIGLLVNGVGWAEIKRLNAKLGGEEALGEIELQIDLGV